MTPRSCVRVAAAGGAGLSQDGTGPRSAPRDLFEHRNSDQRPHVRSAFMGDMRHELAQRKRQDRGTIARGRRQGHLGEIQSP